MKNKNSISTLISLCLHGVLIWMVAGTNIETSTTPEAESIKIELTISEKLPTEIKTSKTKAGKVKTAKTAGSIPKEFIPKWDTNYLSGSTINSGIGRPGLILPFGQGSSDLAKLEQFSIYDLLYKNIDELLVFPSILASNKMEGTVNVQTFLKDSGELDWSSFKISGGNEYFQIYVLRVLKTIFSQPLRAEYRRYLKSSQPLDMSFSFDLSENGETTYNDKKKFIMGHVLAFHKFSHQSSTQWKLGPLYGMFPLPYINLNIGWIVDRINHADPLAKFISENKL